VIRAVIRADASTELGVGHVTRCLVLAQALRERGAAVSFVCREAEGDISSLVEERGFVVTRLDGAALDWKADADATNRVLQGGNTKPQWLIVDHYGLDERWEMAVRPAVGRILAIDDLADRAHDCDVLLDQNLVDAMDVRYEGKTPRHCTTLLGPRYALLDTIYRDLRRQKPPSDRRVRRILVSFGGVDREDVTTRVLQAFAGLDLPGVQLDVVVGQRNPHASAIAKAADRARITLHMQPPSLAPLLAQADLAVGAGGTTTWERLCIGVPSLVITVADNQKAIARHLHGLGLIRWLGHEDQVGVAAIQKELQAALADSAFGRAAVGRNVVDGLGAARVASGLVAGPDSRLRLRLARASDEALLLEWANDVEARRNAFSRGVITPDEHHSWMSAKLADTRNCILYVAELDDGSPVGQVRFDRDGDDWLVSYSLGTEFRGRKLGRPLLEAGLEELARKDEHALVTARVKQGNESSHRIFRGLGFESSYADETSVHYRRAL
jgi:UDP-2,4-diacetamido-2,4,6-trideoxy-beta-L-altropyranose hydrolase